MCSIPAIAAERYSVSVLYRRSMQGWPTSMFRMVVVALLASAVVIGLWVRTASDGSSVEASVATEPTAELPDSASLNCDVGDGVFGSWVKCAAGGGELLQWPDGVVTAMQATRAPVFVGDGEVALVDAEGAVLETWPIRITPDIALECSPRDDDLRKVFKLEQTELRVNGWDYVFSDIATGDEVRPGDPGHPNGGSEDGLERILLSEVSPAGLCRITSNAAETLDADYLLTLESPWEATQTTPMRIIGPSSKTQWAGAQPATLTGTVTINNVTASERVDVYQSGCS